MKVYNIPNLSIQKQKAPHYLKQGAIIQNSTRSCPRQEKHRLIKTSLVVGSIASPILVHDHQATTSLWSLPLPGVLTSAHINKLMIIARRRKLHATYKQTKGKLV